MNTNIITSLRNTVAVSALVLLVSFCPVAANAYTSTGADGQFQPSVSVVFDSTQQIFNFTSIFIPNGVTVSFSGLASAQPIELLATGNIDIAGTLDVGTYSLWIETPSSISITGSLDLAQDGFVNLTAGGNVVINNAVINTGGGNTTTSGSGVTICALSDCSILSPPVIGGGGNITIGGGGDISICSANCSIPSLVPEPSVWTLLIIGLGALFATSKQRLQNICRILNPKIMC